MSNGNVPDVTTNPIMAKDATLRDMFAGQIIGAYVRNCKDDTFPTVNHLASYSYNLADAMLAARKEDKGGV